MLPGYEKVRTHPELYDVARSGWAKGASFHPRLKDCDIEVLKAMFSEVQKASEEFPMLSGAVSIIQATAKGNYYAEVKSDPKRPDKVILSINAELFASKEALEYDYAADVALGYHPAGTTWQDLLVHEMGHALEHVMTAHMYEGYPARVKKAIDKGELSEAVLTKAYERMSSNRILMRTDQNTMVKSISQYASSNSKEAFAEAFTDWHANKQNANSLSIEIIDVIKEILE